MDVRKLWDDADDESKYKNVCDVYGAEHLARLIGKSSVTPQPLMFSSLTWFQVSLPELLAQTNMDQQSVSRLREEIGKFTNWLGKNCETYFVSEYETPSQEYVDKARSF
jgi:mortality factor 4-like protein 1